MAYRCPECGGRMLRTLMPTETVYECLRCTHMHVEGEEIDRGPRPIEIALIIALLGVGLLALWQLLDPPWLLLQSVEATIKRWFR